MPSLRLGMAAVMGAALALPWSVVAQQPAQQNKGQRSGETRRSRSAQRDPFPPRRAG